MIVQKFGGTSVADSAAILRLVGIVRGARAEGVRGPAVVVSAMSGVTDGLIGAAEQAGAGMTEDALRILRGLRNRHMLAVSALAAGDRADVVRSFANLHFDQLESVVRGLALIREVTPRTLDAFVATGEILASRIVSVALEEQGLPGTWVDARQVITTDADFTRAAPLHQRTYARLQADVVPLLDDGLVPVIGGFIGATADGVTTTLGRGGSDYSGALVGAGIGAQEIQIWTDVDGMLTGDPRIVSDPKLVPSLSFREAAELAYFGAKVLHPSTIQPAVERDIAVRILNSFNPEGSGTLISSAASRGAAVITAIAGRRGIAVIDITSSRMLMAHGFLRQLFEVFERFQIPVDVVTTSEVSVSVTVDDNRSVGAIVQALSGFAEVSIQRDMAILCAVGENLRFEPTAVARLLGAISDVPLQMVSQAASRTNITVVLRDADLPDAMRRLHEEFFRGMTLGQTEGNPERLRDQAGVEGVEGPGVNR